MNEYIQKVSYQLKQFFSGVSANKKIASFCIVILIVLSLAAIFYWAGQADFSPFMSNLNTEDSTAIIRILREKKIPFKVDVTGKNISIPPESVYELRLELATLGLPQSSVVGYELFDKQSLGTTSFIQKINQKRAQEGELMRTINSIRGVKRSRVHLALPQRSTFIEDQKKSTASVVIDLEAGVVLSEKQVYGIGNLVARAVEGLDIADVVVMDSEGKVLSKNPSDPLSAATATQLDYQEKVERDLEKRVEFMLSRVLGEGHVAVKVNADLDFSQSNETQTIYDADSSAIRSVEKHNDSMNGVRPGPYGTTGAASNSPGQPTSSNGEVKTETTKSNEVTNFEVPQTIRRTKHSSGTIKRLSVAVVVDGKQVKTTSKDGAVVTTTEPWGAEKLLELEQIVSSAVGLDLKRGDHLDVKNIEFIKEDFEEAQRVIAAKEQKAYVQNLILYAVIGLAIFLFFFFVVKPFVHWITENTIDSVESFLPQTIEELEKIQRSSNLTLLDDTIQNLPDLIDPAKSEGEMIKEKVITLVETNPHKAALILKEWLHGEPKKKLLDEKAELQASASGE